MMAITHNNSPDKTAIRIPILVRQTSQQIAQHIHLPLWEAGEKNCVRALPEKSPPKGGFDRHPAFTCCMLCYKYGLDMTSLGITVITATQKTTMGILNCRGFGQHFTAEEIPGGPIQ
jgi:hypothetical protein